MAWSRIEDVTGKGLGIAVTLKNGEVEQFLNGDGFVFLAQKWNMNDIRDKSDGEVQVGFFDKAGEWQSVALFPAQSYSFVKVILGKPGEISAAQTKRRKKQCAKGHFVFEDEMAKHNREMHDPIVCKVCRYEMFGTKMLEIHMSKAPNH